MGKEIERKFIIKELPADLESYAYHELEQGYLNTAPVVRVRREDDTYYLTYKGSGFIEREEYNLPLTKDYELFGGRTAEEAAAIFDDVLENRATEGQKNTVLANAAVAIQCMDQSLDILEALDIARESLESGKALANFKKFVELNS